MKLRLGWWTPLYRSTADEPSRPWRITLWGLSHGKWFIGIKRLEEPGWEKP